MACAGFFRWRGGGALAERWRWELPVICCYGFPQIQASEKRAETFRALQHALDELCKRMTECEERNTSIVSRLTELDSLLNDEKSKWKVRVGVASLHRCDVCE